MAHPFVITLPVAAVLGGIIGLAYEPWWKWGIASAVAGLGYAFIVTVGILWLLHWLRRGSPERQAGVIVGGWIGAICAALVGMLASTGWFPPINPGESAELFATGAIGLFLAAPIGFALGGIVGGVLVALFEWLDTRYVAPLRAQSVVVERAIITGVTAGLVITGIVFVALAVERAFRRRGQPPPVTVPDWIVALVFGFAFLGLFWAIRGVAKWNREGAPGVVLRALAADTRYRRRVLILRTALGFAGGVMGFLVGVALHTLGYREKTVVPAQARRKARPGWWRTHKPGH